MAYSTLEGWQGIGETGVIYDLGSLYERFHQITDQRKAKGKRYSLVMLLVIIFLGKLVGKDKPLEIAAWAKNNAEELVKLLNLERDRMPHHNTIRRVFHSIVSEAEFDRMAQAYSQQEQSGEGEVLAMDGKALRGTRIAGQEASDQVLSVYDVTDQQVLSQSAVDIKENEIVVAPQVLERVNLKGKIVTGDALHTQRAISQQIVEAGGHYVWPVKENQPHLHEAILLLFAPDNPKPGFGKITTDIQVATKVNSGHGRIETRTIQTSSMLNDYVNWPGVGQVYRLQRDFSWRRQGKTYKKAARLSMALPASLEIKFQPPSSFASEEVIGW
jgi:hypothetical protein